ncbi:MAG: pilus assembly protein [Anaerolineales bacterium]|nr:pilus assembly protein [Anaerolineales bacterium]
MLFNLQKGQGSTEYGLSIMLVGIAVIIILWLLGPAIGNLFSDVVNSI